MNSKPLSNTWKQLGEILMADRAMGMAVATRSHLLGERLARKHQDGTLGQATREPEDEELQTMQVHVGPSTTTYQPPREPSSGRGGVLAAVLGAALAGTAGWAGNEYLTSREASPEPEAVATSPAIEPTYEIRLSSGDPGQPQSSSRQREPYGSE